MLDLWFIRVGEEGVLLGSWSLLNLVSYGRIDE